jgi:hypothetical protein
MNDLPPDSKDLQDTEAQVRRALGLNDRPAGQPQRSQATFPSNDSYQPKRRTFVRDGDVPVTVVRHANATANADAGQLEAARTAMRSLAAAKERAERVLVDAQAHIRDLQTKLGHERLARDEAAQRVDGAQRSAEQAVQTLRSELAIEKLGRERAEQALRDAQATISELTEKLHAARQSRERVRPLEPTPAVPVERKGKPGRPPRVGVVQAKPPAGPRQRTAKPVKWWLGER